MNSREMADCEGDIIKEEKCGKEKCPGTILKIQKNVIVVLVEH